MKERENKERKRELDRKPRGETERKIGLSGPFFALCVVLEMSRKFRCHLGASTHHANAPLARKARIRARKYFPNTMRTILLASLFLPASSIQTQMRVLDLSQGRKRGLKNVKRGLKISISSFCARANTRDANDKNKFSSAYLLASIDVRV